MNAVVLKMLLLHLIACCEKECLYTSIPYGTELEIEKTEQNGKVSCVLLCRAKVRPFDNCVEFIIDEFSRENIAIVNNMCINKYRTQCDPDCCGCNPSINEFRVNFTMSYLIVGQSFACKMRFLNEETRVVTNIFISKRFNGTDFKPAEYDINMIKNEKDVVYKNKDGKYHPESGNVLNDRITLTIVGTIVIALIVLPFFIKLRRVRKDGLMDWHSEDT